MAAMRIFDPLWWPDHFWLGVTLVAVAVMLVSFVADRRRSRRKRIDDVGFMPWSVISLIATLVTLFGVALTIKVG